jgi:hypothetical protein
MCEFRKELCIVSVAGAADMPEQGCFCSEDCTGHTGVCTNQVPVINTEDNVQVLQSSSAYGQYLAATRDIAAGEILTVFGGVVVKKLEHAKSYALFSDLHKVQQRTEKSDRKVEYSAQTGSYGMKDSQAWVIPPQDMPLLQQSISAWGQASSQLNTLVKQQETWQQGLGQFAQHTCCAKHVNAYFFPICVMRKPSRGRKRLHDEESMDLQALAIRAQKAISKGDEILVHYVGAGKSGDFVFDCACCKCLKKEGCAV